MKRSAKYQFVNKVGPDHEPQFTVRVTVGGRSFYGVSRTKKRAKYEAAKRALKHFSRCSNGNESIRPDISSRLKNGRYMQFTPITSRTWSRGGINCINLQSGKNEQHKIEGCCSKRKKNKNYSAQHCRKTISE